VLKALVTGEPVLKMKARRLLTLANALILSNALAGSRFSATYSVIADSVDAGGARSMSAQYENDGSLGGTGGIGAATMPAVVVKPGYIGQLYEVTALALSADPTNVNEGATRQLDASALLDDGSTQNLSASSVAWSVSLGPIDSVSPSGLATAARVYQDTAATVVASGLERVATLGLLVHNISNDDFGSYAIDGLDDAWQVQYFGLNNPNAGPNSDPDGDGQDNRYEYLVGSNPTDRTSYFRLFIQAVHGHPTQRNIIFSPRVPGRTYSVQYKLGLDASAFTDLDSISLTDVGLTRTVTDLSAAETSKFYRVRITLP